MGFARSELLWGPRRFGLAGFACRICTAFAIASEFFFDRIPERSRHCQARSNARRPHRRGLQFVLVVAHKGGGLMREFVDVRRGDVSGALRALAQFLGGAFDVGQALFGGGADSVRGLAYEVDQL
jgi:hypothetical protein